jgi:hypothetical protein
MPRKLPKTGTDQFMERLEAYGEQCVRVRMIYEMGQGIGLEDATRKRGTMFNELVKMFETKGT